MIYGVMRKRRVGKDVWMLNILGYLFIILTTLLCLLPFIMIVSASFSSEDAILRNGFSVFPQEFTLEAYRNVFEKPAVILRAYLNTILLTVTGTGIGLFLVSMTAYVLQRKDFTWRNGFSFFFYFTTIFNGGLVPTFLLMVKYLHLKNHYLALLLPLLFSVFNLLLMKSYMSSIPQELTEAAKIDGCSDFKIFIQIYLPLAKSALATIALFMALDYWNDWYNNMLYINEEKMYTLQYFLQQKVNNIEAYKKLILEQGSGNIASLIEMPTQTLKMALTVVVTGPIVLAYPFAQKYFVKGISVGAVKG